MRVSESKSILDTKAQAGMRTLNVGFPTKHHSSPSERNLVPSRTILEGFRVLKNSFQRNSRK
jgi:hypothetical protein